LIKKEISIAFEEFESIHTLEAKDQFLCKEAVKALENSHSPYSRFRVGVAVELASGKIIYGSNQENVAFPSGLCAERVALFAIGANYPDDEIISMAVTAQTNDFKIEQPITPCGSCLQVMAEYEKRQNGIFHILLSCIDGPVWKVKGVNNFLPLLFFENRLNKG
jgi:cytidine deaminase